MQFRAIFAFIFIWVVMTIIRVAIERMAPHGRRHRRPSPTNAPRQRQEALTTLGLRDGATPAEIEKSYKRLRTKYHPDRVAHLGPELIELTSEKFKEVTAAYEYLASH
jgi:DnaJ like chaperone protein